MTKAITLKHNIFYYNYYYYNTNNKDINNNNNNNNVSYSNCCYCYRLNERENIVSGRLHHGK